MARTPASKSAAKSAAKSAGTPASKPASPQKGRRTQESGRSEFVRFITKPWVIAPLVVLALALIFAVFYWRPIKVYYRELREAKVAEMQLIAIRDYNNELRDEIASLETTAGIEAYAQRSLGLTKAGDHVIVVYQDGKPLSTTRGSREADLAELVNNAEPFGAWTGFLDRLLLSR